MRPALAVCGYFAFIFVGGALLAPWLHKLVMLGTTVSPVFQALAEHPFHRFVHRSFLLFGLIGLWPFLRSVDLRSWSAAGLGWGDGHLNKQLSIGFAFGFCSLLVAAGLVLLCGGRVLQGGHDGWEFAGAISRAAFAAVVVSVMEELLFRGAVFGALRRSFDWRFALLVSTGLYAIVHFFQRPPRPETVDWSSGLLTLGQMLAGLGDGRRLEPAFFSLLLAGWILGLAYQRSGSLYVSIGLHAGWVFWSKFYGFLTQANPPADPRFWGSGRLADGWVSLLVLVATLGTVERWLGSRRSVPQPPLATTAIIR